MKNLLLSNLFAILLLPNIIAQPVAKTDVIALLGELPAFPTSLAEAYQRTYTNEEGRADAEAYYQPWLDKFNKQVLENQSLTQAFYQKYPTGIRPQAKPVSRATPQQQASMEAATSEFAQKMLSDPAFAQKFAQMSEQEQQAYIAKLLADKGIKPVQGTPDADVAPMAGMDVEWAQLCIDFGQSALDMSRWQAQTALQQKYEAQHQQVRDWAEAEHKKLPLIEMGEYGHDHDPVKVQAIQKQALDKHCEVAAAMTREAATLFIQFRQQSVQRMTPLHDALKKVNYGTNYDFGFNYPTVLGGQSAMLSEINMLLTNEIAIIEEVAQWEKERRNFK